MSRNSRRPDAASSKRGKKGKGANRSDGVRAARVAVRSQTAGVPFGVVVAFAAVLAVPSLANHLSGGLTFAALMTRAFAALAVAWLLSHLVFAVFTAMNRAGGAATAGAPGGPQASAGSADGWAGQLPPLRGTIVDDDPYAVPPMGDVTGLPPLTPVEAGASLPQD